MCTVLYLPQGNKTMFVSLRDEQVNRPKAKNPVIHIGENCKYIAPIDTLAGGSWLGCNSIGYTIILLNGGFKKHVHTPPYTKSRGLIVTALLDSITPVVDWQLLDLSGIEPCTIIIHHNNYMFQLTWDGKSKHKKQLPITTASIWSSATLYDSDAVAMRALYFNRWLETKPSIDESSIMEFFCSVNDATNGFIVNRHNTLKTISATFIARDTYGEQIEMSYNDLQTNLHSATAIAIENTMSMCSF
jgi:hypothetical protein